MRAPRPEPRLASGLGLLALVALAIALRGLHLGWPPLWADEA